MDRSPHRLSPVATIVLVAALAVAAGCTKPARPLTVASKNSTEQLILGEIVAQHAEKRLGKTVERRLGLGNTLTCHEALQGGEIDVYPEYTGAALVGIHRVEAPPDPGPTWERAKDEYLKQDFKLFPPLGFEDAFILVVRPQDAERLKIARIGDLEKREGVYWKVAVSAEFIERPDGLRGLNRTYKIPWAASPITMDPQMLVPALRDKQVGMSVTQSTDGWLRDVPVTILEDDQHSFPPYQGALVMRRKAIEKFPGIEAAFNELSGKISNEGMREMNWQVDIKKRQPADVARDFLKSAGL